MERPVVQILVVVASTQARNLWAEEEKGFTTTVLGCESVDPNRSTRVLREREAC